MRARDVRRALWRGEALFSQSDVASSSPAILNHYNTRRLAFHAMGVGFGRCLAYDAENVRRERVRSRVAYSVTSKRGSRSSPLKKRDGTRFETRWRLSRGRDRAGCAAWLREGLRARAQAGRSMQKVADDAAQRAAEIWRVVARFAERWLRVTRRRARRARATPGPFVGAATDPARVETRPGVRSNRDERRTPAASRPGHLLFLRHLRRVPHQRSQTGALEGKIRMEISLKRARRAAAVAPRRRRPRRLDAGGGGAPPPPRLFLRSSLRPRLSVDRQNGRPFPSARRRSMRSSTRGRTPGTRAVITREVLFSEPRTRTLCLPRV